jgi:hypothetical protein
MVKVAAGRAAKSGRGPPGTAARITHGKQGGGEKAPSDPSLGLVLGARRRGRGPGRRESK